MNLVDSSGWLEYFADGKNAKFFTPVIEDTKKLIVSAINLYEIFKKILKEKDENSALQAIALMQQANVVEVNASIAISAAKISYDKNILMTDSLIYTTARLFNAIVWTQDSDFKDLEGVKFIKKK
ncbi:MAG: type II toxin-antitoxin system VapC family toxin [Bacteroidetes bacterium]|nr:type II toxin-antitoxin system VapC family toxin [Bacteroidota bacterium]